MEVTRTEATPATASGRLARSFVANVAGYAVSLAAGLLFTPFLVRTLGPTGFGLVPLANTVATYLSLVTLSLNATVGRFVLIALERGDLERARRLFSTAVVAALSLAATLIVPLAWGAWNVNRFLSVPPALASQARWLFLLAGMSFLAAEARAVFEVSLFCRHRLDLRSALGVADVVVRIGLVVALFALVSPRVSFVGAGMAAGASVSLLGAVYYWRKLTPELPVRRAWFSGETLRELTQSGAWISFGQLGTLLFLAIDLVVVNRMFGAEQTGRYAAVLQWSSVLRGFAGAVSVVFAPRITQLYAQGHVPSLVAFSRSVLRLGGVLLAIPVGLVCGFSEPLLQAWIGPELASLSGLLSLLTFHLCVNLAFAPLVNIPIAMNRVRTMGLVQTCLGVCNLALAVLLAGPCGLGLYGIALAGLVVLTAKNVLFNSMYAARLLRIPSATFLRELAAPVVLAAATVLVARGAAALAPPGSLLALGASAMLVAIVVGVPGAWLILNVDERRHIRDVLGRIWSDT